MTSETGFPIEATWSLVLPIVWGQTSWNITPNLTHLPKETVSGVEGFTEWLCELHVTWYLVGSTEIQKAREKLEARKRQHSSLEVTQQSQHHPPNPHWPGLWLDFFHTYLHGEVSCLGEDVLWFFLGEERLALWFS